MKAWGCRFLLVCAATTALALPVSAGAYGLPPQALSTSLGGHAAGSKGLVLSSFKLKGSHGYALEAIMLREGSTAPIAGIKTKRQRLSADYEVPAEKRGGIHATFGTVGSIAVGFHRQKRSAESLGKHCRAIFETGVFRGRFSFAGEGGYTEGQARSVPGEVLRLPDGFCFFNDRARRPAHARPDFLQATSLVARSRTANGSVELEASALKIDPTFGLTATVREKVGTMKITRSASTKPRKDTVVLGLGKKPHSADLRPPAPFEGSAHFEGPPGAAATWTGDLTVSLPGAPNVVLAGPEFRAKLCLDASILQACTVKLPPGEGHPQPAF